MGTLIIIVVLAASVLVVASGMWVAVALFAAVRRVERPAPVPRDKTVGKGIEQPHNTDCF